jgi:3-hydroxyacyl-CoA dehydrogenase
VKKGALGQKTGAGFYKKEGKAIKVLDPKTGDYVDGGAKRRTNSSAASSSVRRQKSEAAARIEHPQAQFLWAIFRDVFHYIGVHLESDRRQCARCRSRHPLGFRLERRPVRRLADGRLEAGGEWVQEDIDAGKALSKAPLPKWVFEGAVAEKGGVHTNEGSWSPASKFRAAFIA